MEFVEVFKHAQRMCKDKEFHCSECPLKHHDGGCQLKPWEDNVNLGEAERRVMAWAKEHPELQYPTWGDWLAEMGIINWEDNGDGDGVYSVMRPTFKMCAQIPADIAEKLGLKPKEANGDG